MLKRQAGYVFMKDDVAGYASCLWHKIPRDRVTGDINNRIYIPKTLQLL